jgi:hypothetical protein
MGLLGPLRAPVACQGIGLTHGQPKAEARSPHPPGDIKGTLG